jgi:uncharacterized protein YjbJ (UPF0337 family)
MLQQQDRKNALWGEYIGVVESVDDPEKFMRVRVRVYDIFPDVSEDCLPWATYKLPIGARPQEGEFVPVKVGDLVWVDFPFNGDTRRPRITGSVHYCPEGVPNLPVEAYAADTYHKACVFSQHGVTVLVKEDGSYLIIQKEKEAVIEIDADGKIKIASPNDIYLVTEGNANISAKGDVNFTAQGDVKGSAQGDVAINAGGSVDVKSTGPATLSATGPVTVNSKGATKIKALGMVDVSGIGVTKFGGPILNRISGLPVSLGAGGGTEAGVDAAEKIAGAAQFFEDAEGLFYEAANSVADVAGTASDLATDIADGINEIVGDITDYVGDFVDSITEAVEGFTEEVQGVIEGIMDSEFVQGLTDIMESVNEVVNINDLIAGIQRGSLPEIVGSINVPNLLDEMGDFISENVGDIVDVDFAYLFEKVQEALGNVADTINIVGEAMDTIMEPVRGVLDTANLAQGVLSEITGGMSKADVLTTVNKVVRTNLREALYIGKINSALETVAEAKAEDFTAAIKALPLTDWIQSKPMPFSVGV